MHCNDNVTSSIDSYFVDYLNLRIVKKDKVREVKFARGFNLSFIFDLGEKLSPFLSFLFVRLSKTF